MIFFTDLDGTLIRSAKKKRGGDIVVEHKDGQEIACISSESAALLSGLYGIIPVTSRSIEQYKRINIPGFSPKYAITDNGGNLLTDGVPDKKWAAWADEVVWRYRTELKELRSILQSDENRSFEIRFVDERFLFTKSGDPGRTLERLSLAGTGIFLYNIGAKIYAVPPEFDKGSAVMRFAERFGAAGEEIVCAGDSIMDISMLKIADISIYPDDLGLSLNGFSVHRDEMCEFTAKKAAQLLKK